MVSREEDGSIWPLSTSWKDYTVGKKNYFMDFVLAIAHPVDFIES